MSIDGTSQTTGAIAGADALRDENSGLTQNVSHARYRARLVNQGKLLKDGVELGRLMRDAHADDETEDGAETPVNITAANGASFCALLISGSSCSIATVRSSLRWGARPRYASG